MNIGLVAHDSKKKLMQNFCIAYRGILSKNDLYATGTAPKKRLRKDAVMKYDYKTIEKKWQDIWEEPSSWLHRSSTTRSTL